MRNYLRLIKKHDLLSDQIIHHANELTQKQFNSKVIILRAIVKELWDIMESGKITWGIK